MTTPRTNTPTSVTQPELAEADLDRRNRQPSELLPNACPTEKVCPTWLFWLMVMGVVITPRVTQLDWFYARDELTIWSWVDHFALAVMQADWSATFTPSDYPGIPLFWAQSLFLWLKYSLPHLFTGTLIPLDQLSDHRHLPLLAERRLVAGLFTALQTLVMVRLLQKLVPQRAALIAAIILGLCPFTLTEARLLRLEAISANFVCLSLLTYFCYFQQRHVRWIVLSGCLAGLAVSSKTSAGLMVPFIWLLLFLELARPVRFDETVRSRLLQVIRNGLMWAGASIATFWLIWPALWLDPLTALQHVFMRGLTQVAEESVWHGNVFFGGQLFWQDPGPFFYPVVYAFRTTPLVWVGLLGLGGLLANRQKRPHFGALSIATLLLIYVVVVAAELTLVLSKVDRFLVLTFPALNIAAAIGLAGLTHNIMARFPSRNWLSSSSIVIILMAQLGFTLPAHPHYYSYWNPLLGGGQAAQHLLPMGSGEGVGLGMDYLNSLPDAADSILVCGASRPWCANKFKGETWRSATYINGQWFAADYASLYVSHLQRQTYPQAIVDFLQAQPPLQQITLAGATVMSIYAVPQADYVAEPNTTLVGLGQLLGYSITNQSPQRGQTLQITVWWLNDGADPNSLHLRWLDSTGYEWGRVELVPQPSSVDAAQNQPTIMVSQAALPIPSETPPGEYQLQLTLQTDANRFPMSASGRRLTIKPDPVDSASTSLTDKLDQTVNQPLNSGLTLIGYTMPDQPLTPVAPTWLSLYWQATQASPDGQAILRLLDDSGHELTRWQRSELPNDYPMQQWRRGQTVKDVWSLQAPPDLPLGWYDLVLTLEDRAGLSTTVELPPIELWASPINYDPPPMQINHEVTIDQRLTLLGYDLFLNITPQGSELAPVFHWQSQADMTKGFELAVALVADTEASPIQTWRLPLGERKTSWKAAEILSTPYQLAVAIQPEQAYHLEMTLYEQGSTEPLKLARDGQTIRIDNLHEKITVRVQ